MAGVDASQVLSKAAILDVQKVLRGLNQRLAVDGIWGPISSDTLSKAPDFIRVAIEKKLTSAGVDVSQVVTVTGDMTLKSIAHKAIEQGISGPSLVNFLTTLRMESNFQPRRESHVYRDPSRAREMFSALRSMSDEQIQGLVNSGARSFFEAVYGYQTRKGKELGNTNPGDGYKYRGNGPIQITGRSNHELLEKETGIPAASDPDVLTRDADASLRSAIWYWKRYVMKKGQDLDIVTATKVVNPRLGDVSKRIAMARHYSTISFV